MKLLIKSIFAAAILLIIAAGTNNASAQIKIGYVDSEVILKQLPEAQRLESDLEVLQKQYLDTVGLKENELKTKLDAFQTRYADAQKRVEQGASESEVKTLNDEINTLRAELQNLDEALVNYKQIIQNNLLARQQELFKPLKEKITRSIESVAKGMSIAFVFDKADGTLLYGDKQYDITFKVLDALK